MRWRERWVSATGRAAPGALWCTRCRWAKRGPPRRWSSAARRRRGLRLLLTHGTATGREAGRRCCIRATTRPGCRGTRPARCARFCAQHRPRVGVLMETEIWPNLLHAGDVERRADGAGQRAVERGSRAAASASRPWCGRWPPRWRRAGADRGRCAAAAQFGAARCRSAATSSSTSAPPPSCWRAGCGGAGWPARWCWPRSPAKARRSRCFSAGRAGRAAAAAAAGAAPSAALRRGRRHGRRLRLRLRAAQRLGRPPPAAALDAEVWLGDSMGEMPLYYARPTWRCSAAASRRWAGRT